MKSKLLLAALCAFVLTSLAVAADVVVPVVAKAGSFSAENILTWLTPLIVPLILAGVKKIAPKIPSWVIPWAAPVLGVLLDVINSTITSHQSNIWLAAGLGALGIGIRELKDSVPHLKSVNGGWPKP